MKYSKLRIACAGALALAFTITSQIQTLAQTNGVVMIVTRYSQDLSWYMEDGDRCDGMIPTGAGMISQGDVQMAELLGDHGYPTRVIIDMELQSMGDDYAKENPYLSYYWSTSYLPDPSNYLAGGSSGTPYGEPFNADYKTCLIIQSGSANSSRAPQLAKFGIPYMTGEHMTLGTRANKPGACGMYGLGGLNYSSDLYSKILSTNQWMRVTAAGKLHPILQGIPLDANDCVKIYRDPYPEEVYESGLGHMPAGGNALWEWDIPTENVDNAAPCTTVLGIAGDPTKTNTAIFAVADVGSQNGFGTNTTARMVHIFVCEGGGNSYRRVFNSLSDMGRLIFVRACKWAMGETLAPYQPLGIIKVSQVSPSQIKLAWTGTATKNYKVMGSASLSIPRSSWQLVADDIKGVDVGDTTTTLDISAGPQYAFLMVKPVP